MIEVKYPRSRHNWLINRFFLRNPPQNGGGQIGLFDKLYKKGKSGFNFILHPKLNKSLEVEIKTRLGIPVRYNSPARTILENSILPFLAAQNSGSRVLFVGCDWYTKHYKGYFKKCAFWTIDPDPAKRRFGSKNHIVGYIEQLEKHFSPEYFDLIICNGVLGYGLNQLTQAEQAFDSCYTCLRRGGRLLIGREDDLTFLPFSNDELQSLHKFVPYFFPPLGTTNYSTKPQYNYTFSFFEKPPDVVMSHPDSHSK